jgi:ketosteroid isomerase-like protein
MPFMAAEPDHDVALVLRAYEAYARGDIEQAVTVLHPDVEWIEPAELPNGGPHHGAAAVAEYLRAARSAWAELVCQVTPYRRGDAIVVIHHVSGRLTSGAGQEITLADVFTLEHGLVVGMVGYADPAEALAAAA